jgi:PEP-CTERM motif
MIGKQIVRILPVSVIGMSFGIVAIDGAPIAVPNGNFENWQAIGDGGATNAGWASIPTGQTPSSNVGRNDEMWTNNPSSFASGWQSNGPAGLHGKYGLQQPSNAQHVKVEAAEPWTLAAPFNGNFIGFINMAPGGTVPDGAQQSIQSGILGNLMAGTYSLTVAFGARRGTHGTGNNPWNDYRGTISLVSDPVLGAPDPVPTSGTVGDPMASGPALGSRGGMVLGTPASVVMQPSQVPSGSAADLALEDLTYMLSVPAGDPNIGKPFAIRIDLENLLVRNNGESNPSGFTQGNFDNVRLDFVAIPEPGTIVLFMTALLGIAALRNSTR